MLSYNKCGLVYERGVMLKAICLDIGGTSIKYGVLEKVNKESTVKVIDKWSVDWDPRKTDGSGVAELVYSLIEDKLKTYDIELIGISTAGVVDVKEGSIVYANENIPNYTGFELKKELEKLSNCKVAVENDVNCAALAEYFQGSSTNTHSSICLTIGTGVGGGVISEGKLLRGDRHSAMEVGYIPIGNSTLERLGSTSGLVKRCAKRLGYTQGLNGETVFDLALNEGNEICLEEIDNLVSSLAQGLKIICHIIDPEVIILGGGIMHQEDFLIPRIQEQLNLRLPNEIVVKAAKHLNEAGLVGAFYNGLIHWFNEG